MVAEHSPQALRKPVVTIGMQPSPCPTSHSLEKFFYADMSDIIKNVCQMKKINIEIPSKEDARKERISFKGPF